MSEDYKKIALEDVKKGQRVRIVYRYPSHIATYEGVVVGLTVTPDMFDDSDVWDGIDLGSEDDMVSFAICPDPDSSTDILLLEDAPEPKAVRTATVKYYDDGTKEETPDTTVWVPTRIETMEQFEEYEEYLKTMILSDRVGDYWKHDDTEGWGWRDSRIVVSGGAWHFHANTGLIHDNLPMTIVENVGD